MKMPETTILLADDHAILRQGLASLLSAHAGLSVVGEAADGRSAVAVARELAPDVVLMDVSMPDLNGIDATRQMTTTNPEVKVIALSAHGDCRYASEMLRAGAKGYLLKDGIFEELVTAIRTVMNGQPYLSSQVAGALVEDYVQGSDGRASVFFRLSPREREVLQLMAEGRATKEIAIDLHVSVKTVETHRRQIMEKLNLFSVAELTKYAIGEGLTSVSL